MNRQMILVAFCLLAGRLQAADPADIQDIDQKADEFHLANPAAMALTYEDQILISQIGAANYARSEQFGVIDAYAAVSQQGSGNAAATFQADGIDNDIRITQLGNNNYVVIGQSGDSNSANLNQYNDNNRFVLDQRGGTNSAIIDQFGNSSMSLHQTGDQSATISLQGTAQGSITQLSPTLNLNVSN